MFETPPEGMRGGQVARDDSCARNEINTKNLGACQATEGLVDSSGDKDGVIGEQRRCVRGARYRHGGPWRKGSRGLIKQFRSRKIARRVGASGDQNFAADVRGGVELADR